MNKCNVDNKWILFIIISLMIFVSLNIVEAKTTGELDGNTLTIKNDSFINGNNYSVSFRINGSSRNYREVAIDNTLNVVVLDLTSEKIITVSVKDENNTKVIEDITLTNNNTSNSTGAIIEMQATTQVEARRKEPTSTEAPSSETANTSLETQNNKGLFNFFLENLTYISIGILSIIVLAVSLYIYKSKDSDLGLDFNSNVSQLRSNFHKLNVVLIDDSSTVLLDKNIIATNKKTGSQQKYKSDINGEFELDLMKGKYEIKVEGKGKHEDASQEINLKEDANIKIPLTRRQSLQIEVVDESGNPLKDIKVRLLEGEMSMDSAGSPTKTDASGIAEFYISKNKQYVASVESLTQEFIKKDKIHINNSETSKKIQLTRRTGTIEVVVTEQPIGKAVAGIPVTITKKNTNNITEFLTDDSGKINQKLPVGDYIIRLKQGNFQLYESVEKHIPIVENKHIKVVLDFKFNYKPKPQYINSINAIDDKLAISFNEVSAYDNCVPLFFMKVGEKPTQYIKKIIERPVEFLGVKSTPDEIITYTLETAEFLANEISRIMREKSNVDFYYSIQKLDRVNDLSVSDYSPEKFSELVRDTTNYHKNHFREIGNKLNEIDIELTQLSQELTIQPVADLWRVAQKMLEINNNESNPTKKGVMLFINDKLLDHIREMYTKDEVRARLKFSMV